MNEKIKSNNTNRIKAFLVILVMLTVIFNSKALSAAIISGAGLALMTVIPSLFPMFIISDFFCSLPLTNQINSEKSLRIFERLFGISNSAIGAFICGNLCGFPIGASCSSEMLSCGIIDRDECERLVGLCSCPSAAFVISGVGIGICKSVRDGICLYVCAVLSAILCGIFHRSKGDISTKSAVNTRQKFVFSNSIKTAATRCINVCAHISFFSALLSITDLMLKNPIAKALSAIPIEVSNAAKRLSEITSISLHIRFALIGAAIGFSGICVLMQVRSVLPSSISMKRYTVMKIEQGMICAMLSLLCSIIFR